MSTNNVPYYDRRGLDAEGVSAEWLREAEKQVNNQLAEIQLQFREAARLKMSQYMNAEYQSLKRFEDAEVLRGKKDKLENDLYEASVLGSNAILSKIQAANKQYKDDMHDIDQCESSWDEPIIKRWRSLVQKDFDKVVNLAKDEMVAKSLGAEEIIDNAIREGVISKLEGQVRKKKAANAAFKSIVLSLADNGLTDVADSFINDIEKVHSQEKSLPKDEGNPKAKSQIFIQPLELSSLRDKVSEVRTRAQVEERRMQRESAQKRQDEYDKREYKALEGNFISADDTSADKQIKCNALAAMYRSLADDCEENGDINAAKQYLVSAQRFQDYAEQEEKQAQEAEKRATARAQKLKYEEAIAKRKAYEESLEKTLSRLVFFESKNEIDSKRAAKIQLQISKELYEYAMRDDFDHSFLDRFRVQFAEYVNTKNKDALRKLYTAFGYHPGDDTSTDGSFNKASGSKRNRLVKLYPVPDETDDNEKDNSTITAEQLSYYGMRLLAALRNLPEGQSRDEVVDQVIRDVKSNWVKNNFQANLSSMLNIILTMRKNFSTDTFKENEKEKGE